MLPSSEATIEALFAILEIFSFSLGKIGQETKTLSCLFPNNDNGGGLGKLQERLKQEGLCLVLHNEFWVVLEEEGSVFI